MGSFYQAWFLFDQNKAYRLENQKKSRSFIELNTYDCENRKEASEQLTFYSGNMGKGNVVGTGNFPYRDWKFVIPQSVGESMFDVVCAYDK
ncbi:MAG: hypothetical protein I3J00_04835 [Mesosutterella multiformis]|nr:hypothetical protein [Mesosutterella multiformis]